MRTAAVLPGCSQGAVARFDVGGFSGERAQRREHVGEQGGI